MSYTTTTTTTTTTKMPVITYNGPMGISPFTSPNHLHQVTDWPPYVSTIAIPIINQKIHSIGDAFTPVKAGKNGSHVILVVDESGSMFSLRKNTIDSVNEFISSQRKDAIENCIETIISVFTFDGVNVKCIINKVDVKSSPSINEDNYNPIGMTNLNDAFGSVIAQINTELSDLNEETRSSVIIAIMTDGMENASRSFSIRDINQMVTKCQEKNWAFVFLGANIDAFSTGVQYGFNTNNTLQYVTSATGLSASLSSATRAVSSMKADISSGSTVYASYQSSGFTDDERKKSMGYE